ncbi:DNA-binding transcriptional LysR family regulator [Peribacillus deserti]|uniref:DNA-binding transcriptional LysR family regulator n=1 Tax=Peribacillus deserti TaxID=673318 RepID=A0ABS2QDS5_9BACI|nr:LysR family transcriptional regulator [Peribacillus deserti]MBM7691310.1 DNA-binding transcriptional LysR family regulator [Peribacillus deserti]
MDIRQLRYFIAIVEEGNITAAAKRLHIAQPPLSQQLKLMEEELGVILLERQGKKSEVTDAGHALYKHALQITSLFTEGIKEIKEIGQGIQGQIHIGVNTLSSFPLSQYLLKFQEKYSNVTYKIIQSDSPHLTELIEERELDLAIVMLPISEEIFHSVSIEKDSFAAVFPNNMNIENPSLNIMDIAQYPLILPSIEGLGIHTMITKEFNRLNLEPNIIGECSDIALLLQLVSSGFGVSIVPQSVLAVHPGICVHSIELTDTQLESEAAVIWLKDRYLSKAAEQFIRLLAE